MTDEVQATIEFVDESAPQRFFCKRCGQCHKAGECKEVNQDGQRADKEDS
jgi:hypothetical protein